MLDAEALADHTALLSMLSEQIEVEATALLGAGDGLAQLLHLGGLTTLTRLLTEETARLTRLLTGPSTPDVAGPHAPAHG